MVQTLGIVLETLISESATVIHLARLVVPAKQEYMVRILQLVGHEETEDLNATVRAIHVVPQEEVSALRRISADMKHSTDELRRNGITLINPKTGRECHQLRPSEPPISSRMAPSARPPSFSELGVGSSPPLSAATRSLISTARTLHCLSRARPSTSFAMMRSRTSFPNTAFMVKQRFLFCRQ